MAERQLPAHRVLYGVIAATVILSILVTPFDTFVGGPKTYLDADFRGGKSQGLVALDISLQDRSQFEAVPDRIGDWAVARTYTWDRVADVLNADTLLSRDYRAPDMPAPAALTIIYSTNMSSFHSPELCFRLSGWKLMETNETKVEIPVEKQLPVPVGYLPMTEFNAKRFVLERETSRGGIDTLVTYHVYVKREESRTTTEAFWIRGSMYVPPGQTVADVEPHLRGFFSSAVPLLIDLQPPPPKRTMAEAIFDSLIG